MAIYRGVNGINREINSIHRGVDGVNREINEQWRGVNGLNKLVFSPVKIKKICKKIMSRGKVSIEPDFQRYLLTVLNRPIQMQPVYQVFL